MIDAHTHIDINADDPISDYLKTLDTSNISEAVLILNNENESRFFWENTGILLDSGHLLHLAFLFDVNYPDGFEDNVNRAKSNGLKYSVKLHPRISNITERDFCRIGDYIENIEYKCILVDSFLYGSNKENICYIELSTYLAKRFKDKTVVMAHFGGAKALETMLRTRDLNNVFYDISLSINYLRGTSVWSDLRHCIMYNTHKTMFGSDTPSFTPEESRNSVIELLGHQSDSVFDDIFTNTARRVYFE